MTVHLVKMEVPVKTVDLVASSAYVLKDILAPSADKVLKKKNITNILFFTLGNCIAVIAFVCV